MDNIKELQERQTSNLLKAIELKNMGIADEGLEKIVDFVINHEISELKFNVVLYEREKTKPKEYKFK